MKRTFEKEFKPCLEEIQTFLGGDGLWDMPITTKRDGTVYATPNDTKVISKVLESQVFPILKKFADDFGYELILPKHQNHYPDATLRSKSNPETLFAVDLKTTYRNPKKPTECNGFTLGSHGTYFHKRDESKNITFPYNKYTAHYSLCVIYDREDIVIDETKTYTLETVPTPISNFTVFLQEKWKIASDKRGSGNTANIGSIKNIKDLIEGKGLFSDLGEQIFDNYWLQYGETTKLKDFIL